MKTPHLLFSLPLLLTTLAGSPASGQESAGPDSSAPVDAASAPGEGRPGALPNSERRSFRLRGALREVEVMTDEIHVRGKNRPDRVVKLSGRRPVGGIDAEAVRLERDSGDRADLVAYVPGLPKTDRNKMLITRRVTVKLAEGVTPSVFASSTGAARAQQPAFAPEALVLTYASVEEAATAAEVLRTRPEVLSAEVVIAVQHYVENIPSNVQYFTGGGPNYANDPTTDDVDTFILVASPGAAYQWWANNIPTMVGPRNAVRSRVDLGDLPPVGYSSTRPGVQGELADLRLPLAWENPGDFNKPVSGNGKKVLIVDDGIQAHPDLTGAIDLNNERHYNFFTKTKAPGPTNNSNFDPHGTSLAGIAGARIKPTGSKIAGVAPGVIFHSAVAAKGFMDDVDWAQAYALGSTLRDSDLDNEYLDEDRTGVVYYDICLNASSSSGSGDAVDLFPETWLWKRAIRFGATRGRALAGVVYVTSAGNGGDGHMDVNYAENKNSIYQIPVAGVSDLGRRISSSNAGASIVCAAPTWGDELPPILNWPSRPVADGRPPKKNAPIGPDDVPAAYRRTTQGIPTITTGNAYNFDFSGTSASAAMVTGVAALILEANPELQARDVKEILLRSSRVVNDVRVTYDKKVAPTQWRMGRLGRPLSHVFGAGLVDANKAVQMAKRWAKLPINPLPPIKRDVLADDFGKNIANRTSETGGLYFPVTSSLLIPVDGRAVDVIVPSPPAGIRLEHIEVRVQLYHKRRGDLEIKLIAPPEAGWEKGVAMESDLFVPHRDDYKESRWSSTVPELRNPTDWTFTTVRHWGTRAGAGTSGVWKVRIRDASSQGATMTPSLADPVYVPVANPTDAQSQRIQGVAITYHGVYSQTLAQDPPVVTSGKLRLNPGTAPVRAQLTTGPLAQDVNGDVRFPVTNWDLYNSVDIVPVQPSNTPRDFFEYFPPARRSLEDANTLIPLAELMPWPSQPLEPVWVPFTAAAFTWTDDFALPEVDLLKWASVDQGLESTAVSGLASAVTGGRVTIGGTAASGPWAGLSLRSEQTFATTSTVTAEVDRVALTGTGTGRRSSLWLWGDAGHYLHFSQHPTGGGWTWNASDEGGTGTLNPTGDGNNLTLLDFADAFTGQARMKLVWLPGALPGQGSIQIWRDTVLAATHKVTNWPSSVRVQLTGQAAQPGDTVSAVFDNVSASAATAAPTTGASGGLTSRPAWATGRKPVELTPDNLFMIVRDTTNTNAATNFIHARLNRKIGQLEIVPANKGKYNLSVFAENLVGMSQPKLHEIVVANPTYTDWADIYWDQPNLGNPAVAGFLADPDNDGIMNGLEFAMRLDPLSADPGPVPAYREEGNEMVLTYYEDVDVAAQVKLHPQTSPDLLTWTDTASTEIEVINGLRTVEVRLPITGDKSFFRLWAEPLVPVLGAGN